MVFPSRIHGLYTADIWINGTFPKKQQYALIQFHILIAKSLGLAGKTTSSTSRWRGSPSPNSLLDEPGKKRRSLVVFLPGDDIRLERVDHLPQFQKSKVVVGCVK